MKPFIHLTTAEIQSKFNRQAYAERLILELPQTHEGRNTWLLNYGTGAEAQSLRDKKQGSPHKLQWNRTTESLDPIGDWSNNAMTIENIQRCGWISKDSKLNYLGGLSFEKGNYFMMWIPLHKVAHFIIRDPAAVDIPTVSPEHFRFHAICENITELCLIESILRV